MSNEQKPASEITGYQLLAKLGQGGMGVVYKAKDVASGQTVALKVMFPHLAREDTTFIERFLREAQAALRLQHPNIVSGLKLGKSGDYHFFAMEYVDGTTLNRLLKEKGKLPEKEALDIIWQVAQALNYAHQHNLVHRDVKPENILIAADGTAKLADLGLAKSIRKSEASLTLTQTGMVMGTAYYMSPEQIKGEKDIDGRADIYSLGAAFYHLVAGDVPFDGPSSGAIMAKHLTEKLPSPKKKNPELSLPVCHLIRNMMLKDKQARYQLMSEVLIDLKKVYEGQEVVLRPEKVGAGAVKPLSMPIRKTNFVSLGITAAVILVGLFIIWRVAGNSDRPIDKSLKKQPAGNISASKPPVPPPIPVSDTKARDALAEIEKYARENPAEYEKIISRYQEFINQPPYKGTPEYFTALNAIESVKKRRDKDAEDAFQTHLKSAEEFLQSGEYEKAVGVWNNFPEIYRMAPAAQLIQPEKEKIKKAAQEKLQTYIDSIDALLKDNNFLEAKEVCGGIPKELLTFADQADLVTVKMKEIENLIQKQTDKKQIELMVQRSELWDEYHRAVLDHLDDLLSKRPYTQLWEKYDAFQKDEKYTLIKSYLAEDRKILECLPYFWNTFETNLVKLKNKDVSLDLFLEDGQRKKISRITSATKTEISGISEDSGKDTTIKITDLDGTSMINISAILFDKQEVNAYTGLLLYLASEGEIVNAAQLRRAVVSLNLPERLYQIIEKNWFVRLMEEKSKQIFDKARQLFKDKKWEQAYNLLDRLKNLFNVTETYKTNQSEIALMTSECASKLTLQTSELDNIRILKTVDLFNKKDINDWQVDGQQPFIRNGLLIMGNGRLTKDNQQWTNYLLSVKGKVKNEGDFVIFFKGEGRYLGWQVGSGKAAISRVVYTLEQAGRPGITSQFLTVPGTDKSDALPANFSIAIKIDKKTAAGYINRKKIWEFPLDSLPPGVMVNKTKNGLGVGALEGRIEIQEIKLDLLK